MKSPKLDRLDIKILAALQADGRITNRKLADQVGLSPSPCLERVKRLEATGYIRRYTAMIDVEKLFGVVTVFAEIALERHGAEATKEFERLIVEIPEVVECYEVSGKQDFIARFVCKDIKSYHELTENLLNRSELGISQVSSRIVLRSVKEFTGFSIKIPEKL